MAQRRLLRKEALIAAANAAVLLVEMKPPIGAKIRVPTCRFAGEVMGHYAGHFEVLGFYDWDDECWGTRFKVGPEVFHGPKGQPGAGHAWPYEIIDLPKNSPPIEEWPRFGAMTE